MCYKCNECIRLTPDMSTIVCRYERCIETSVFTKNSEFLDQINNYQLFNKNSIFILCTAHHTRKLTL